MSKELEASGCLKIYLETLLERANHDELLFRKDTEFCENFLKENQQYHDSIKQALQRLEEIIDNLDDYADFEIKQEANEYLKSIKQALLKAQEPKKYLKWEDLEFKIENQEMFVLLNGSSYLLEYYTDGEEEFVMIKATHTTVFELLGERSDDKQFFNDLHLERVEEE